MIRAEYLAHRRRNRAARLTRAERGLPHHPDGSGLASCPRCAGSGGVDASHWQPEMVSSHACTLCDGTGCVPDGHRDPLLRLRYVRQRRIRRRNPGAYAHVRQLCAVPAWRIRLIESAVGCELAMRRLTARPLFTPAAAPCLPPVAHPLERAAAGTHPARGAA